MIGRLLLEWRTQQVLEYENKTKQYTKEKIFQDDQMVYLLASHSSALQTDTTKFKQDFIGPLFIYVVHQQDHLLLSQLCHTFPSSMDGARSQNRSRLPHPLELDNRTPPATTNRAQFGM